MNLSLAIEHAHLRCADLQTASEFYQNVLNAEFIKRTEHNGRMIITLQLGGIHLCLSPKPGDLELHIEENKNRLGVYHLAFLVPNLDAAVAECKLRGARFVVENYVASPTRKVAFMEAPDGMQVELMEDF